VGEFPLPAGNANDRAGTSIMAVMSVTRVLRRRGLYIMALLVINEEKRKGPYKAFETGLEQVDGCTFTHPPGKTL
jgi:hypothetical protein